MNNTKKYYIDKKNRIKEMVFVRHDTDKLYLLIPKRQKNDELKVNNILITNGPVIETIIKKKIMIKINKYNKVLELLDEDNGSEGTTRMILDVERFRMKFINEYMKYLGKSQRDAVMLKLDEILKLLKNKNKLYTDIYSSNKGRGR